MSQHEYFGLSLRIFGVFLKLWPVWSTDEDAWAVERSNVALRSGAKFVTCLHAWQKGLNVWLEARHEVR